LRSRLGDLFSAFLAQPLGSRLAAPLAESDGGGVLSIVAGTTFASLARHRWFLACLTVSIYDNSAAKARADHRGGAAGAAAKRMNKKYQVFISSTFTDLIAERQTVLRTVLDLGHIPSGMEIFPAADVEQFDYIKKVIDECDYYVLIIGARYGSMDAAGVSFTEKEYDYAVEEKKTVLAFIHGDPGSIAVSKADVDPALAAKLKAFREKVSKGRLVRFWKTSEELNSRVTVALAKAFGETPGIGWIRGNTAASEELLAQINNLHNMVDELRTENEELKERTKPRLEGIAGLNEVFTIRYRYRLTTGTYQDSGIVLTWAEIFAACGPMFFRPCSPGLIGHAIVRYIKENRQIKLEAMELFKSDENRIKLQLMSLGLIEIAAGEATGGEVEEFASLTPRGRQQLLELLAVRGAQPNSATA
jgi:hypothetical protein